MQHECRHTLLMRRRLIKTNIQPFSFVYKQSQPSSQKTLVRSFHRCFCQCLCVWTVKRCSVGSACCSMYVGAFLFFHEALLFGVWRRLKPGYGLHGWRWTSTRCNKMTTEGFGSLWVISVFYLMTFITFTCLCVCFF